MKVNKAEDDTGAAILNKHDDNLYKCVPKPHMRRHHRVRVEEHKDNDRSVNEYNNAIYCKFGGSTYEFLHIHDNVVSKMKQGYIHTAIVKFNGTLNKIIFEEIFFNMIFNFDITVKTEQGNSFKFYLSPEDIGIPDRIIIPTNFLKPITREWETEPIDNVIEIKLEIRKVKKTNDSCYTPLLEKIMDVGLKRTNITGPRRFDFNYNDDMICTFKTENGKPVCRQNELHKLYAVNDANINHLNRNNIYVHHMGNDHNYSCLTPDEYREMIEIENSRPYVEEEFTS
jgi:hypothetical protein